MGEGCDAKSPPGLESKGNAFGDKGLALPMGELQVRALESKGNAFGDKGLALPLGELQVRALESKGNAFGGKISTLRQGVALALRLGESQLRA